MLTMLTGKAELGIDIEVNGSKGESGTRSNKLEPDLILRQNCFTAFN